MYDTKSQFTKFKKLLCKYFVKRTEKKKPELKHVKSTDHNTSARHLFVRSQVFN